MRDLTAKRFNSNSPRRNYVKLQGQIEKLEVRLRALDQSLIDGMTRLSDLEGKDGV